MKRCDAGETQDGETPEGWSAFQARAFWKSASNAEESSRTIVASHNSSVSSSLSESSGSSPSAGCSAGSHPCGAPCDVFVESKCQAPFGIQFRPLARCAQVYWAPAVPTHKRLSIYCTSWVGPQWAYPYIPTYRTLGLTPVYHSSQLGN